MAENSRFRKLDHGIWSHHFMANRWERVETVTDYFGGLQKSLQMVTAAMKLKDACIVAQLVKNPPAMRKTWV